MEDKEEEEKPYGPWFFWVCLCRGHVLLGAVKFDRTPLSVGYELVVATCRCQRCGRNLRI